MDLMIIAREDDALASHLAADARRAGRTTHHLGLLEASQRFTVHVGPATVVTPGCAVFLRPAFPRELDREALFHHQEAYATVWTAARLSPAPVLNRPSDRGTPGTYSYVATVNNRRCGLDGTPEAFVSPAALESLEPPAGGTAIYVEDQATFDRAALPARPAGAGPYRIKPDRIHAGYDYVTVVGGRAWRATEAPIAGPPLEPASLAIARRLDLAFCVCTWAVTAAGAHVTRVDAFPTFEQVHFNWPAVSAALLEELT